MINEAKDKSIYRYKKDYQRILERACSILHRNHDYTLSVIFVTPERIHEINKEYRNIDRSTDVISFALQDDSSNIVLEEEVLFCHGLLHLMGYDHMCPKDEKEMFDLQDVILDEVVQR